MVILFGGLASFPPSLGRTRVSGPKDITTSAEVQEDAPCIRAEIFRCATAFARSPGKSRWCTAIVDSTGCGWGAPSRLMRNNHRLDARDRVAPLRSFVRPIPIARISVALGTASEAANGQLASLRLAINRPARNRLAAATGEFFPRETACRQYPNISLTFHLPPGR